MEKSILEQYKKIIVLMYMDIKFVERCHVGDYYTPWPKSSLKLNTDACTVLCYWPDLLKDPDQQHSTLHASACSPKKLYMALYKVQ